MAGDVDFLRELESFLDGLDWVQVRYARIAAGGAVDLGVITNQRARLHVDLVERFGAGRVNVAARTSASAKNSPAPWPQGPERAPSREPSREPHELNIDGWSTDEGSRHLTLHFMTGASAGGRYVELVETASTIELRLLCMPMQPGVSHQMSAWPDEVRVELAEPVGDRDVRHPGWRDPAPYRVDGDDVIDQRSGRLKYRRSSTSNAPTVPTRPPSV